MHHAFFFVEMCTKLQQLECMYQNCTYSTAFDYLNNTAAVTTEESRDLDWRLA